MGEQGGRCSDLGTALMMMMIGLAYFCLLVGAGVVGAFIFLGLHWMLS